MNGHEEKSYDMGTSRGWCFTINNPTASDCPQLWQTIGVKSCVYQEEMGESGTRHFQGTVEFVAPVRMGSCQALSPRAHWEKRRGKVYQSMKYCVKEGRTAGPWVFLNGGWLTPSGVDIFVAELEKEKKKTRERLEEIRKELEEGDSSSIERIADKEFDIWCRYHRAFERYLLMKTKARDWEVEVHVLQGPTGTGKSRWALESFPGAYWKQRSNWWDGYCGQETVVIDEFYGWLPFDLLLRICDRYPLLVETKGGQVQFLAKRVIITSNGLPSSWYKTCYFPALVRRVTKWHILPIWGAHIETGSYEEFCKESSNNNISP